MSFAETIFLFFLALIVFGPKKLPGLARQAGRLLAELRRASNEFKSQIETEISHLESENKQTIPPPTQPPPGALANVSLDPTASEPVSQQVEPPVTLAAPTVETAPANSDSATASNPPPPAEAVAAGGPASDPTPQDSHV
jgi:sec-independent protein translocase protein TatB